LQYKGEVNSVKKPECYPSLCGLRVLWHTVSLDYATVHTEPQVTPQTRLTITRHDKWIME